MGFRNATFMGRTGMGRAVVKQRELYMCFVDFEKAFHTVRHELWRRRLLRLRVYAAVLRVLVNLFWGQKAVVKIGDKRSGWTEIRKGVRQGCVLSTDLSSLYS